MTHRQYIPCLCVMSHTDQRQSRTRARTNKRAERIQTDLRFSRRQRLSVTSRRHEFSHRVARPTLPSALNVTHATQPRCIATRIRDVRVFAAGDFNSTRFARDLSRSGVDISAQADTPSQKCSPLSRHMSRRSNLPAFVATLRRDNAWQSTIPRGKRIATRKERRFASRRYNCRGRTTTGGFARDRDRFFSLFCFT